MASIVAAMDIAEDTEKRQDCCGFRQFDAPVCVIITYDAVLSDSDDTAFDCGAVTTALVNAAVTWPGAVIIAKASCSRVVREHAKIADDQVIMKGLRSAGRMTVFLPMPWFPSVRAWVKQPVSRL